MRSSESKIYRRKRRQKASGQKVDKEKQINLKELARNKPELGRAFITNKKSLCHDLRAGWWFKGKSQAQDSQSFPPHRNGKCLKS